MGCRERAASAEFPWTRSGRALSGPGPIRDWEHLRFGGEDTFCAAFFAVYFNRSNAEYVLLF